MKGFRVAGERKQGLIKIINTYLELHGKMGVNAGKYLKKKYKLKSVNSILNMPTKKLSGIISDLKEL